MFTLTPTWWHTSLGQWQKMVECRIKYDILDIRITHGGVGGRVASNGPGEENDVLWLEVEHFNGKLHHRVDCIALLTRKRRTLATEQQRQFKVQSVPI